MQQDSRFTIAMLIIICPPLTLCPHTTPHQRFLSVTGPSALAAITSPPTTSRNQQQPPPATAAAVPATQPTDLPPLLQLAFASGAAGGGPLLDAHPAVRAAAAEVID